MNRTIRRLGILVTIPMIFHFVQVILKKLWKTEPQAPYEECFPHKAIHNQPCPWKGLSTSLIYFAWKRATTLQFVDLQVMSSTYETSHLLVHLDHWYKTIELYGDLEFLWLFQWSFTLSKSSWRSFEKQNHKHHMKSVSHTKQSIINHVLEKAYPPVWSISPEKGPPPFNSLICRWWAVPMRLHTYQFILIIGTKHALHRNGNTVFWATISHQEQRATT